MKLQKRLLLILYCGLCSMLFAQTGGKTVFNFLDMPVSARVSALGGRLVSIRENTDYSLPILNPSMLNQQLSTGVAFNCVDYFSDAVYGHFNYMHHFSKVGTFNFAFQFATYGSFVETNEFGEELGTFTAGDYGLIVGYGRELVDSMFSLGMNLKLFFSDYAHYFSSGMAVDFAASYYCLPKNISLTLLLKNIGVQFNPYDAKREKLPFDIQLAFSQRLKHLPVRYNIILHHLYTWKMSYDDPTDPFAVIDAVTNTKVEQGKGRQFFDNMFRHFTFALEILPVKYISIQVAFDYNTRKQMRSYDRKGMVGFSYGLGVHIRNINVYYARSHNNLASTPNHFTFSTQINSFFKK